MAAENIHKSEGQVSKLESEHLINVAYTDSERSQGQWREHELLETGDRTRR